MVNPSGSIEEGPRAQESAEAKHLVVTQPDKFQGLLETISLMDKVSERLGEDSSGDMGSDGSGGKSSQGDDGTTSTRASAIANIPDTPEMRKSLGVYIQKEIKILRKQARKKKFHASAPGSAHQINDLYSKIRRLNTLFTELMETSVDALKRLFIKVFIDKQTL
jgi:hypothetical protein